MMTKARMRMSRLVLYLLLIAACEPKPTEEELVRECQNRNGTPNVQGQFNCEMPQAQNKQQARPPERYD
jgi:hypothetical protein